MNRLTIIAEAHAAGRAAKHNLKWIRKHPDRIDASKRKYMEAYLRMMIRFAKKEMKNARRAGRAQLRHRSRNLFVSIIPHTSDKRKEAEA